MPFLIRYWPYIGLVLALAAFLIGGNIWWHNTKAGWIKQGYDQAMAEVKIAQEEANQKIRERKKKETHNAKNLDSDSVNRELCKFGWMRDFENCPK